jgi:hypothetical protein
MDDQIGSIIAGVPADIIALDGDALNDSTAIGCEMFVMNRDIV